MAAGIFSTYRQGENRVTSTFLSVLERLSVDKIERVIGGLLEDDRFQLIRFDNQVRGKESVPDARIWAKFSIWIETKTSRDALTSDQVERHLACVGDDEALLLLTPDWTMPASLRAVEKVQWASFRTLNEIVQTLLGDTAEPPTEREAFLLRQFSTLLETDGLLASPEDVVLVVAAGRALLEYERYSAYICQPNRNFQKAAHLAFYANARIHHLVPAVVETVEAVTLTRDGSEVLKEPKQRQLVETLVTLLEAEQSARIGEVNKVIFLSAPGEPATFTALK